MARPTYHHGDLRRALLDATLALAAERGPAAVSLREAARLAGVSPTAPYRHFADRVAMLAAASEEGFDRLHQQMVGAAGRAGGDPRAELVEWAGTYVAFAVEQTAYFRMMFGQGSPTKASTPTLQAAARTTFQLLLGSTRRFVDRHASDLVRPTPLERPPVTPHALAFAIWSVAHGMASLGIEGQTGFLGTEPSELGEIARQSVARLLRSIEPV